MTKTVNVKNNNEFWFSWLTRKLNSCKTLDDFANLATDELIGGYDELKGKRLGIIGLGKIGSQVAKIGQAFGMEVSAWSENLNLSEANKLNVLPMSKEDLFKTSDILSIHVVLGDKYKNKPYET